MSRWSSRSRVLLLLCAGLLVLDVGWGLYRHRAHQERAQRAEIARMHAVAVGLSRELDRLVPPLEEAALQRILDAHARAQGLAIPLQPREAPADLQGDGSSPGSAGSAGPAGPAGVRGPGRVLQVDGRPVAGVYVPLPGEGPPRAVLVASPLPSATRSPLSAALRDVGLSAAALMVLIAALLVAEQALAHSLGLLEAVVVRLGRGDYETRVTPPAMGEFVRVAKALEYTRRRIAKHIDELTGAKQALADELAQARARLRDPVVDRRRAGVARLGLQASVRVGRASGSADLVDFWLDFAVLAVDRDVAKVLVPGQPVVVTLTSPDGTEMEGEATAQGPTRERVGPRVGWAFGWNEAVAPGDLWAPLWHAVNPRRELRHRPPDAHELRAIVHVEGTQFTAEVRDLSRSGIGVLVREPIDKLGSVGSDSQLALTLQLPGGLAVQDRVWVRSLEVRAQGTRLGLALDGQDPTATEAIAKYLLDVQREAEPDAEAATEILP